MTDNNNNNNTVLIDYEKADYRGFVFVLHEEYGLMMLRCTRKKTKPPHWQLPGGHIDKPEFIAAGRERTDRKGQLILASKMGLARELFEETGMDIRNELDRLVPAALRAHPKFDKDGNKLLPHEHKHRLFYFLVVTDNDFKTDNGVAPIGNDKEKWEKFKHVKLRLSVEHTGFTFEPNPDTAAEMLIYHSGGKVSDALKMAMQGTQQQQGSSNESQSSNNNQMTKDAEAATNRAIEGMKKIAAEEAQSSKAAAAVNTKQTIDNNKQQEDKPINLRELSQKDFLPPPPEKKSMFSCFKFC